MSDQLDRIETMLGALLASSKHLHWVGFYAHHRTSRGDPYIALYPISDKLQIKICRVYDGSFKKLPSFIDTDTPPAVKNSKSTLSKNEARDLGLLSKCLHNFKIVTHDGKDTQMGPERRFFGSLWSAPAARSVEAPAMATYDRPSDNSAPDCSVKIPPPPPYSPSLSPTQPPVNIDTSIVNNGRWGFLGGGVCPVRYRVQFVKYEKENGGKRPFSYDTMIKCLMDNES